MIIFNNKKLKNWVKHAVKKDFKKKKMIKNNNEKIEKIEREKKFEIWEKHLKNKWNKVKFRKLFLKFFIRKINQITF